MELHITLHGRKDLADQLYRQLRDGIDSGRLAAGTQLPPTRLLAEQLGVSRKTVAEAYSRLTYDNLLSGQVGRGTFITPQPLAGAPQRHDTPLASAASLERWRARGLPMGRPALEQPSRYDFAGGVSSKAHFPFDSWRQCSQHALRQCQRSTTRYGDARGLAELREAIARHIAFARGVHCDADNVQVCSGAQQALDLIARVLIEPGCTVAMEDPGYPPARHLFEALGARIQHVPVEAEGIRVELIEAGVRLIYVTPSHQFPLGMPMALARRHALLARAAELGAVIVEDDYDSEFRYEGRPTDALQSLDQHGLVAYVGTFSKTVLPELRLGYAILPPALLEPVRIAKQLSDWHTSTLSQWTLARFIGEGHLQRHIRRCHGLYAARRERILQRLDADLSPWFEAVPSTAGYHLSALAKDALDVEFVIALARKVEVGLYSLRPFYSEAPPQPGLLLGFGAIELLDIDPALDRLRDTLQSLS
ncbi:PLP-dependent aminotransferase family protein [Pseudomonas sp. 148P]|uniref:PLP-dependent aminotransferase family protein n=1 Tax=Pseudomonas ulcerans TaxID=3115852 RepID=A0ABU7HWF1_9PSED|nr:MULTISPECIES: PLP-dependent aminotransferase family protein [unclassified Pseudomonas]MEE1924615.1 PLP-dependent aminotransferase family protein [Pseudomonas sp. 147P]MEE1935871.1 PLP-dependent aminotransferase family protein [Pseudomonas sp. 148P]